MLPFLNIEKNESSIQLMKYCIQQHKMQAILAPSGYGKTYLIEKIMKEFNTVKFHYLCLDPTITKRGLLDYFCDELGLITNDNLEIKFDEICFSLRQDNKHCFIFDECENLLWNKNGKKDIIRRIYDQSHISIILSGDEEFKRYLQIGNGKRHESKLSRRLYKINLYAVSSNDLELYLIQLEKEYNCIFSKGSIMLLNIFLNNSFYGSIGNLIDILSIVCDFYSMNKEKMKTNTIDEALLKKLMEPVCQVI